MWIIYFVKKKSSPLRSCIIFFNVNALKKKETGYIALKKRFAMKNRSEERWLEAGIAKKARKLCREILSRAEISDVLVCLGKSPHTPTSCYQSSFPWHLAQALGAIFAFLCTELGKPVLRDCWVCCFVLQSSSGALSPFPSPADIAKQLCLSEKAPDWGNPSYPAWEGEDS